MLQSLHVKEAESAEDEAVEADEGDERLGVEVAANDEGEGDDGDGEGEGEGLAAAIEGDEDDAGTDEDDAGMDELDEFDEGESDRE